MAYGIQAGVYLTSQYAAAGALRFVQRGEKRILQQEWMVNSTFSDASTSSRKEWRDVPLVGDDKKVSYDPIGGGDAQNHVDRFPLGNINQNCP